MRYRRSLVGLLAFALVAVACEGGGDTDEEGPSSDPILFAASLPLTGMFSIPGDLHRKGYELCVDLINERGGLLDRPVELVVEDNRSDTETVVSQYERFINVQNVDVLLGTFSTLLSFPASSIAEQAQMVFPEPSDSSFISHSRGYEFNFGFTLKPIDLIGETPVDALSYFADQGVIPSDDLPTTAAVVRQDDFFPDAISLGLVGGELEIPGTGETIDFGNGYLEDRGIDLVFDEEYPAEGFDDWVGLANRAKASGAEYLLVLTTGGGGEVEFTRALKTVDYVPTTAFYSQGTYAEFQEALGSSVNGIIVWTTWAPEVEWEGEIGGQPITNQEFVEAYEAMFDDTAQEDQAQAFAVCQAMEQGIRAIGSTDNVELQEWMASRTAEDPIRTIQGDYHFDEMGLTADRDLLLLQWQEEELEFIYPVGEEYPGTVDPIWPQPAW
jgi:branched-chain amino acid transport system substrate-binding protein